MKYFHLYVYTLDIPQRCLKNFDIISMEVRYGRLKKKIPKIQAGITFN